MPHKPSIYEYSFNNATGKFKLERYLGGFYRDFVPRRLRRRSRVKFDFDGNPKYEAIPTYHKGFPVGYKACHKAANGISDMGAPTYWRLARLQTQMTSDRGGTKDTTQEPQNGGQSIVVLSSIQSGYSSDTGARCNEIEGYYTDEEINLQATGILEWIKREINQLPGYKEMFSVDKDSERKVINQKTTLANPEYADLTTAIVTTLGADEEDKTSTIAPGFFVDVIKYDKEDYYDPELWPELEKYQFQYSYPDD